MSIIISMLKPGMLTIVWLTRWYHTNFCIYMNESLTCGLIDNPLKVYSTPSACVHGEQLCLSHVFHLESAIHLRIFVFILGTVRLDR